MGAKVHTRARVVEVYYVGEFEPDVLASDPDARDGIFVYRRHKKRNFTAKPNCPKPSWPRKAFRHLTFKGSYHPPW